MNTGGSVGEVVAPTKEKQSYIEQYDEIVIKNRFKYENTKTEENEDSKPWPYDIKKLKMKV